MNIAHPKNLEVLRGECDKLGSRIARLAFIRTTLFVLFVFSLASAFQAISSQDVSAIVDRIRELMKITKDEPELSYFLKAIYFPTARAETKGLATGSFSAQLSRAEEIALSADEAATGSTPAEISPAEQTSLSAAEREQLVSAQREQKNLEGRLTAIANEAFTFTFKAPLLGTEIKLDMRIWGFILPLCFIFWEVYLGILRHKLRTLQRIAGVITLRTPKEATVLDQVQFEGVGRRPAAFSRHPAQFEFLMSLSIGTALIVYLCVEGHGFWEGADPRTKRQLIELYGFVIVYAACYAAYVKRRITAQAETIEGFEGVTRWLGRFLVLVRPRLSAYARRIWPEVNLATGSTMIIATLWLLVGAPLGCQERTGLGYLRHPDGWLVGPACGFGAGANWHNFLIATLYAVGLAVAAFTLVLLLISLTRRTRVGQRRLTLFLASASTVLALFFLTELAIGQLLDLWWGIFLPLWVIPLWIWWRHAYSKREALQSDWPRVRKSLFYWYVPQAAVALIVSVGTLFENEPLIGVPVFVCGLATVALGYWNAFTHPSRQATSDFHVKPSLTRESPIQVR